MKRQDETDEDWQDEKPRRDDWKRSRREARKVREGERSKFDETDENA